MSIGNRASYLYVAIEEIARVGTQRRRGSDKHSRAHVAATSIAEVPGVGRGSAACAGAQAIQWRHEEPHVTVWLQGDRALAGGHPAARLERGSAPMERRADSIGTHREESHAPLAPS